MFRSFRKWIRKKRMVVAGCGHNTYREGCLLDMESKTVKRVSLPRNPPYCLECLTKQIKRCSLCGRPIFPGDPVIKDSNERIYCCRSDCYLSHLKLKSLWG